MEKKATKLQPRRSPPNSRWKRLNSRSPGQAMELWTRTNQLSQRPKDSQESQRLVAWINVQTLLRRVE
jgi:hypothetical protein